MSTDTLRRRIADGRLPAYRSGARIIRVDPSDVDQLLTRIPAVVKRSWDANPAAPLGHR